MNDSAGEMAAEGVGRTPGDGPAQSHALRRTLGLRDLVPMQILLVVGITWAGSPSVRRSAWLCAGPSPGVRPTPSAAISPALSFNPRLHHHS